MNVEQISVEVNLKRVWFEVLPNRIVVPSLFKTISLSVENQRDVLFAQEDDFIFHLSFAHDVNFFYSPIPIEDVHIIALRIRALYVSINETFGGLYYFSDAPNNGVINPAPQFRVTPYPAAIGG